MALTKKEIQEKKDFAKMLFLYENLTQKEIAKRANISQATISKWVTLEKWESHKVSITINKEEQLKNLYRQLAEINKAILSEEAGKRYATSAQADTITKLANAIGKMETDVGIADIVSVLKKLLCWLRKFDLAKAQEITPLIDAFIKENLQ